MGSREIYARCISSCFFGIARASCIDPTEPDGLGDNDG